jgi:hypothetical protein
MAATSAGVVLEPAVREFLDAAGRSRYVFELRPAEGRQALADI